MNKDAVLFCLGMTQIREIEKEINTYYEGVKKYIYKWDSCVHPQFSHCGYSRGEDDSIGGGTQTGRLSCTKPNVQNTPRNGKIKDHFVSRYGKEGRIVTCDFSQIEVVAFAFLTKDPQLVQDLKDGLDIHCVLGEQVYGEKIDKQDPRRQSIKPCTFLVIYGGGYKKLAKTHNLSEDFCKSFVEAFYKRYPVAKEWQDRQVKIVQGNAYLIDEKTPKGFQKHESYLTNITGRKLYFKTTDAPQFLVDKGINTGFNPAEIKNYPVQCVDADTEFLTSKGWKKIKDFDERDVIAEYCDISTRIDFKHPKKYIKATCDNFYSLKKQSLDMVLTENHRILYASEKTGYTKVLTTKKLIEKHDKSKGGFSGKIINTFNKHYKVSAGLSESLVRLLVAYQADGTLYISESLGLRNRNVQNPHIFHFTKQRKIDRLIKLLDTAKLTYKMSVVNDGSTIIRTKIPFATQMLKEKIFTQVFNYEYITPANAGIISDETQYWDGNEKAYWSNKKENADFVQYCHNLSGHLSCVSEPKRGVYTVWKSKEKTVSMKNMKVTKTSSSDGYAYCFETSTGYWLARRNGRVFITGNSLATADIALMMHGLLWREAIKHRDKFLLINQVHDDICSDVRVECIDFYCDLTKKILTNIKEPLLKYFSIDFDLSIMVEFKLGNPSWGSCQKHEVL